MPSRPKHQASKTPNLATVVAAIGVRRALRPFVSRRKGSFVALLPGASEEVYLYQNAAGIVLQVGDHIDKVATFHRRSSCWNPEGCALEHLHEDGGGQVRRDRRGREQEVSREILLLLDFEAVVERPTPIHFLAAARKLGVGLSEPQALELSKRALKDVQWRSDPGVRWSGSSRAWRATREPLTTMRARAMLP